MTDWCILRVAPASTLRLASSLAEAGFEVWTPVETVQVMPKQIEPWEKPRPNRKGPETVTRAMLSTFVFARADRLTDLIELSRSPVLSHQVWESSLRRMVVKGHPFFTLFRSGDDFGRVPDKALVEIRRIASKRKPRGRSGEPTGPSFA